MTFMIVETSRPLDGRKAEALDQALSDQVLDPDVVVSDVPVFSASDDTSKRELWSRIGYGEGFQDTVVIRGGRNRVELHVAANAIIRWDINK